jgi:hypothetical protein
VLPTRPIDVAEHRRERRGLTGARGAGDEDEPAVLVGKTLDSPRHPQGREVGDLLWDHAKRKRDCAALPEAVHPVAHQVAARVGDVELAGLAEVGLFLAVDGGDLRQDRLEVGRRQRAPALERDERAVASDDRRSADLEMHVRSPA